MTAPGPDPAAPLLRVDGLGVTYGRGARSVEAVRDVSFELPRGTCLGLLGVNGSGKSTTIQVVLGLLPATRGTVTVLGGKPGRRAARARTGYVPEEARRFGRLTGREAVRLFAALQGVRPRRERVRRTEEALEAVGLERTAWRRRLGTYSRGMARRLALAAAWVHRPALLVLDEPTSGLDPLGTERILELLDRHRREGGSTLLSTHDRVTAEGACDEVLVLRTGRLALSGRPRDLLGDDASPSLARLLRDGDDA